jgi:hypothetical protein
MMSVQHDVPHTAQVENVVFGMQDADGKTAADLTTETEIRDMLGNLQLAEDFQKDER